MLKQIMAMTWKELKISFKDPGVVAWMFFQPFVLIVVLSFAMGGSFGDSPDESNTMRVLALNQDQGTQAANILGQLDDMDAYVVDTTWEGQALTRQVAEGLILDGEGNLVLIFPPDFSQVLAEADQNRGVEVLAIVDPAPTAQSVDAILATVQGLIERAALRSRLPEGADFLSPVTVQQTTPSGTEIKRPPDAFQQNVPGVTIYGIFWIVSLLAGSVFQEKREGTFRRLLIAPMSRAAMLTGKVLPYYLINLLQIATMMGLSGLLFGVSMGRSPAGLVVVSLAAAATATGLGVLLAALARTQAQVGMLASVVILTLAVLGGCFVPRWVMPDWLRTLGLITPHAWAVDAYQDLMVQGYGLLEILPKTGALVAFAGVFFGVGVWRFRFE
jgi:ABC-2 type transport system permease protein